MPDFPTPHLPTPAPHGQTVGHYENFPVASFLCPPALRAPIAAIYHFARTADDVADEGTDTADQRLGQLQLYRQTLMNTYGACIETTYNAQNTQNTHNAHNANNDHNALSANTHSGYDPLTGPWPGVFGPLQRAIQSHHLPLQPMLDLLSAFTHDVEKTQAQTGYATQADLLDYCRLSASPVGRLVLHLYKVDDQAALQHSDAICSALQLINFWQDAGVDLARGRCYFPEDLMRSHGVTRAMLLTQANHPSVDALIQSCVDWARDMMHQGSRLVHRIPGRAGWELRLVVQGGLRILDKVQGLQSQVLVKRPTLKSRDYGLMLFAAMRM